MSLSDIGIGCQGGGLISGHNGGGDSGEQHKKYLQELRLDHTQRFLKAIIPPGTCIELRIFKAQFLPGGFIGQADKYPSTFAGWYDNPDAFIADTKKLKDISAFVTFNPVRRDLLARSDNKLAKAKHTTTDDDIIAIRWLFIDIDPVRPADISATNEELDLAIKLRDRILADEPEMASRSIWGRSGNGCFILVRLPDYLPDETHRSAIGRALAALDKRYSNDRVKIDTATKNPARVCCLPGTVKAKGSHRHERPWRYVWLDSPDRDDSAFDLTGWLKRDGGESAPAAVAPQSLRVCVTEAGGYGGRLREYAATALEREAAAVAAAPDGKRNDTLNRASLACGELIAGGNLTRAEVETTLGIAARSIGLDDHEIAATMASGIEAGLLHPRNLDHVGTGADRRPAMPPRCGDGGPQGEPDPDDFEIKEGCEDNPHALARKFRGKFHSHPDGWKIRFWMDEFHVWRDGAYRRVPKGDMQPQVAKLAEAVFDHLYTKQLAAAKMAKDNAKAKAPRPIPVTTQLANNVLLALKSLVPLPHTEYPLQPCWIDNEAPGAWPVEECVPTRNAIVHLPSFADGLPCTRRPTPRFFCPYRLAYDFAPDAPQPTRWMRFLREVWPDDQESIDTLQEWFGLQLVPDTRYQKIMGLIGPPGSGKGTIIRIMQALIGKENYASLRFSMFEGKHHLASVIGKLSLIIPDGRMSGKTDQAAILESILSISGEDVFTIERKYIDSWTGKLTARITLVSNDLPRFNDASSALSRRLIVLKFRESFEGREDKTLENQINRELPGIFRWAVEGWKRLRDRGHFVQPESGVGELGMLRELSSPTSQFIDDCCTVAPDETTPCNVVFDAWKAWCEANGHQAGNSGVFGRNLRSVLPNLRTPQKRIPGKKPIRLYEGLGLKPPEVFGDAADSAAGGDGFRFDESAGTPF